MKAELESESDSQWVTHLKVGGRLVEVRIPPTMAQGAEPAEKVMEWVLVRLGAKKPWLKKRRPAP